MKIDRIKMLTEMLFENIELLEEYPARVKEWEKKEKAYKEKTRDNYYYYREPYPVAGTSQSHVKDIAKLLRKELLKL